MFTTAERVVRSAGEVASSNQSWGLPQHIIARVRPATTTRTAQRVLNVVVAVIGIILTAPLMLAIALLVKLTSPGPVLYTQTRVGLDRRRGGGGNWRRSVDYGGRLFTIYKFRTMSARQKDPDAQVWAAPNDPRVTPVGRVLRKYRLDELPQLLNVLKGDMNVVGPRPEQPKIFMQLRDQVDNYPARQRVLPGITGWAQVNQQYDQNVDDVRRKVQLDLEYAARTSAMEDLRIMLKTIPVMLFRRGAW
jgi:lipopolysaccharide/colanic/teichoic acid biosynthesis glycosyltransferase